MVGYSQSVFKQNPTIGIHFVFNDFATASAIRESSLSSVLNSGNFAKFSDMQQGFALSGSNGINDHFDVVGMLAGSFLDYPIPDLDNESNQGLLFEGDVSIRGKMLSDRYWFSPYMQLGAGVFKYKGYWGTYIPIGIGVQVNFFDEAYILINSQYRVAVTETTRHHFFYSIGLIGNIGRRD